MGYTKVLRLGFSTGLRKSACKWTLISACISFSPLAFATAPPAPAVLTSPSNTNGWSVPLSWTLVAGASYVVEEQKNSTGAWTAGYTGSATSITLVVNTDHSYGAYYFRVKACIGVECSGYTYSGQTMVINQAPDSSSRRVIYVHTDLLGSPSAETNAAGNLTPTN